ALIRDRFRDLSEFEMKEILRDRMFKSGTYRSHPEHATLYESLEASMDREKKEEFNEEMAKSRKRRRDDLDPPPPPPKDLDQNKKKRHDSNALASKQPPKNKLQDQNTQALSSRIYTLKNHDLYSKIDNTSMSSLKKELEERIVELDEGQAGSDPGKTPESQPPLEEDQAGSNPEQSHVVLAGPNPEPMHEEFVTTVYPQVYESLKLTTKEQVHMENPPSSLGTLSSIKNLDDEFTFSD
nr:hypothetical protein [Tanacetum cinerariifolium]